VGGGNTKGGASRRKRRKLHRFEKRVQNTPLVLRGTSNGFDASPLRSVPLSAFGTEACVPAGKLSIFGGEGLSKHKIAARLASRLKPTEVRQQTLEFA
jgi:hypothetical protein